MQKDFHYYATYCAAYLAGFSHEESLSICYSAQLVDLCSKTFLSQMGAPQAAATTQLQLEMMEMKTDILGLQEITRIWASFHFLPYDLKAEIKAGKKYRNKYRLICKPNSDLVVETVELAKNKSLQAYGLALHVLADTWAHAYFAGTPSLVINNTNYHFYEVLSEDEDRKIIFHHNPNEVDDLEKGIFINSVYQNSENSIMNLGHGRAGHLPDYSFVRYRYMPAWGDFKEIYKDNPSDYLYAFSQMVYALKYFHGDEETFIKDRYAIGRLEPYLETIKGILEKRQLDACEDWADFAKSLSGETIEPFDLEKYQDEYRMASEEEKDSTFLGKFILAALAQKSMVTNKIFTSGNMLAGISIEYHAGAFKGIKDFERLIKSRIKETIDE